MNTWKEDIDKVLADFVTVSVLAGDPVNIEDLKVEYLPLPHKAPSSLPNGNMAIYAFWWNGVWLKVGKVGAKSQARYVSHHYNVGSAQSTLARSLANDPRMSAVASFSPQDPGTWIKASTCRVNILISSQRNKGLLSLLEAFLHVRLSPRYEG